MSDSNTQPHDTQSVDILADSGLEFTLPKRGKKQPFTKGWPKYRPDRATVRAHLRAGGNLGTHNAGYADGWKVGTLDADDGVGMALLLSVAPELGETLQSWRVSGSGKFLVWVHDPDNLLRNQSTPDIDGPHTKRELKFTGQSVISGVHPSGERYECNWLPLIVVTVDRVKAIWEAWTGQAWQDAKPKKTVEPGRGHIRNDGSDVEKVKAAWTPSAVFAHHWPGCQIVNEKGELRILGRGGLLCNDDDGLWHSFAEDTGGDVFNAWAWATNRHTDNDFPAILREMAEVKGITLSEWKSSPGRDDVRTLIPALREWVKSVSFAEYVPADLQSAAGYRTDSTDTKIADALLDVCEERKTMRVILSPRDLALRAGLGSHHTANKALDRLAGWFVERGNDGLIHVARRLPIKDNCLSFGQSTRDVVNTYSTRKADDVFLTGRSQLAKALGNEEPGLGETILRIVDALETLGTATRRELAEHTGKTLSGLGRACRRAEELGLLDAAQTGGAFSPKEYSLLAWETRVEELRPTLKTYNLGLERMERTEEERQRWAEHRLASPDLAEEERAALTRSHARAVAHRLAIGPILRPELSEEEQERFVMAPVPARNPSRAALDERRTGEYERLTLQATGLLSGGLLSKWQLAQLRNVTGRLGVNLATYAGIDTGGGYAWA